MSDNASEVYYIPAEKVTNWSEAARTVLGKLLEEKQISLEKNLPIKIHPGAEGNTAFIKPEHYNGIISIVKEKGTDPFYIETCMEASTSSGKVNEFKIHGFDQIPAVIADGEKGDEQIEIPVAGGKHLRAAKIAKRLAEAKQVLVVSHFKGHCMAGFGGAIKMLGIGFSSGKGKSLVHSTKAEIGDDEAVDWDHSHRPGLSKKWVKNWNNEVVSSGKIFNERVAESAWAAIQNKQNIYLTFALNIVNNCDCDGAAMEPVYKDVGVFASLDPVAIDKAVFDLLAKREGETPFEGEDIFEYAEKMGIGKGNYHLASLEE